MSASGSRRPAARRATHGSSTGSRTTCSTVATADRPTMAVWADRPYYDGDGPSPKPPKSARIVVDRLPNLDAAVAAYRQIRGYPDWTRGATAALVPTKGLPRVAAFDAKFTDGSNEGVDHLWFQLPNRLPAGWYLVTLPAPSHPIQTVLQVTDIAGYLVVSDTKTLVWANDLKTKGPVAGAAVASDGADMGRTGADGTSVVATPAGLNGDGNTSCGDPCFPVVTIRLGEHATMLPADGGDFAGFDLNPYAHATDGTDVLVHLRHRPDTLPAHGHGQPVGRRARPRDRERARVGHHPPLSDPSTRAAARVPLSPRSSHNRTRSEPIQGRSPSMTYPRATTPSSPASARRSSARRISGSIAS